MTLFCFITFKSLMCNTVNVEKFGLETCVGLPVVFLGKALYSLSTILHTGE